jgi:UDP-glucose 4-epimerase
MKVFLTGGAGFIGSHIAESLVGLGHDVTIYDNFSSGLRANLEAVAGKVRVREGDILDKAALFAACPDGVDVISHQAAHLEIFKCIADPVEDLTNNTVGTINVLELARQKGVGRVINASSACVYGQARSCPQPEDHPKQPNWPYGASKLAAEEYGRIYMETFGIKVTSFRYGIVYGPREWYGRVLTMFLARAYNGLPPVVFGDGSCVRDFINVADVVEFHNRCMVSDSAWGRSFNVGTGVGTSVRALAEMVCEVAGEGRLKPVYEDVPEGGLSSNMPTRRRIPQELKQMVLGGELAKRLTGFVAARDLRAGIREEYEWLRRHPDRWNMAAPVKV